MKKYRDRLARGAAIAALLGWSSVSALAQGFVIPNNAQLSGHLNGAGVPPVGTGCTIAAGSTDTAGSCTASAASGSIAFANAYAQAPNCLVTDGSATSTVSMPVYTTTTAQITLTTIISTHVLYWFCVGKPGG